MPRIELSECANALRRYAIPASTADKFLDELRPVAESKAGKADEQPPRVGDDLESVGAKFYKERSLGIQSKSLSTCLETENSIPKDEAQDIDHRSGQSAAALA